MNPISNILRHPATWLTLLVMAVAFVPVSIPDADEFTTPDTVLTLDKQLIGPDSEVIQDFVATGTRLLRVRPRLLTEPVRPTKVHLRLERLVKEQWHLIVEETLLTDPANNDKQFRIRLNPIVKVAVGDRLRMVLQAPRGGSAAVYIRVNPEWQEKHYGLFVNGKQRSGAAVFATNYERTSKPLWRQIPAFIARITVMMGPVGKTLLALGMCLSLAGMIGLIRTARDDP